MNLALFAATILHPEYKLVFFETVFSYVPDYLKIANKAVQALWKEFSGTKTDDTTSTTSETPAQNPTAAATDLNSLKSWKSRIKHTSTARKDKFQKYLQLGTDDCEDSHQWWVSMSPVFPELSKLALYLLTIPAMSSKQN